MLSFLGNSLIRKVFVSLKCIHGLLYTHSKYFIILLQFITISRVRLCLSIIPIRVNVSKVIFFYIFTEIITVNPRNSKHVSKGIYKIWFAFK